MGQSSSSDTVPAYNWDELKDGVVRRTHMLKEIATLSYEEFQTKLRELNQIADTLPDCSGRKLLFILRKGSDTSVLWKGTVQVACIRIETRSKKIESHRLLNLRQFLHVYKMLVYHANATSSLQQCSSHEKHSSEEVCCTADGSAPRPMQPLDTSAILEGIGVVREATSDLDECCICMERKPEVTLPCTHSYCLVCIEQWYVWNVSSRTCPLCREELDSTDDSWVISEAPDSAEMAAEMHQTLMSLTDKLPVENT